MGRNSLAASHGMTQVTATPAPPKPSQAVTSPRRTPAAQAESTPRTPPAPTPTPAPKITYDRVNWNDHLAIMRQMGQSSSDGAGYVKTSQAYIVNRYLRNGGDMTDAHKATPNWSWLSKTDVQRTIRGMDNAMKPLSRNIQGVRYSGLGSLRLFGFVPKLEGGGARTAAALNQWIKQTGGTFSDKAYTSFSTDDNANVFKNAAGREIKFNYHIRKGAKTLMTANKVESEGILARGIQQRATGARMKNGKLEIDVEVG